LPSFIASTSLSARSSVAWSSRGEARNAVASPAARAKCPVPTVALPAWIAPSRAAQNAGRAAPARPGQELGHGGVLGAAAGAAAAIERDEALFFHHHTWSITWPPIISAARSLPETATLRAAGHCCFIRSPSVGTSRWPTLAT
jgi:hypothetical protein